MEKNEIQNDQNDHQIEEKEQNQPPNELNEQQKDDDYNAYTFNSEISKKKILFHFNLKNNCIKEMQ